MAMRQIDTQRLHMEPQVAAHAEEMFDVLADPAIYEYENQPPPSVDWLRERFTRLESRQSKDGREQWLNWVLRLHGNGLIGYVQATVHADGRAGIAYELSSAFWGRGLALEAVRAMLEELIQQHRASSFSAVLKRSNQRSLRLLHRLGFEFAPEDVPLRSGIDADELLMLRALRLSE